MQVKAFLKTSMVSNTVADVFKIYKQRCDRKTTLNLLTLRLNQEGVSSPITEISCQGLTLSIPYASGCI